MVYSVGLTGNIASGKSTVARCFLNLGIQIISADDISRKLTIPGTPEYNSIVSHFGISILNENKSLDRKKLREIIFNTPSERQWLEKLLHPEIRKQIKQEICKANSQYCVVEIPLLTNKGDYPYLNRILVVTSPLETQIERVISRDHCSKEHALAILSTQPSIASRVDIADDILVNDSDLELLVSQVDTLHHKYLLESQRI